ncbi:hypothetical protein D3C72_663200 [compost metagenome]
MRADQHDVGLLHLPQRHMGEALGEGAQHQLERLVVHLVEVEPLHHQAARLEMAGGLLVEVGTKEIADAGHPGVRRLRDQHVVLTVAQAQEAAGVLEMQLGARIGQRVAADVLEEPVGLDDAGRDLDDVHGLHRVGQHGARGGAAAEPDDHDVLGGRVQHQGQVAEQLLRAHVVPRRGVRLAVGAERDVLAAAGDVDARAGVVVVEQVLEVTRFFPWVLALEQRGRRVVAVRAGREHAHVPAGHGGDVHRERREGHRRRGEALRAPAGDGERDGASERQVDGHAGQDRAAQAQHRQHHQGREERAGQVAEGVQAEDHAHARADLAHGAGDHAGGERQGHADAGGRREHQKEAHRELEALEEQEGALGARHHGAELHHPQRQPLVERQGQQHGQGDAGLRPAELGKRVLARREALMNQPGARGDAADEGREHQGEGEGRRAQDQGEQANPGDLEGQADEARERHRHEHQTHGNRPVDAAGVLGEAGFRLGGQLGLHLGDPLADHDRRHADGHVEHGAEHQRAVQAQAGNPQEARHQRAGHGAEAVEEVEPGDRALHRGHRSRGEAAQRRQGPAHQDGRRQQRQGRHGDLGREQAVAGQPGRLDDLHVAGREPREEHRRERGEEAHANLEPAVERELALGPVGQAAEPGVADGQAAHEGREHHRVRQAGVAEHGAQQLGPDDLVNEADGA